MRWYCVLCLVASRLKNSTLRLLKASVIFTPSSRKTRSSGAGRKSATTFGRPMGSSVYLIFAFINLFAFPPVSRANYPDDAGAIGEANGEYATANRAKAEIARLFRAVHRIFGDHTSRVGKGKLRQSEVHPVLEPIRAVLRRILIETGFGHLTSVTHRQIKFHTIVWLGQATANVQGNRRATSMYATEQLHAGASGSPRC